MPLVKFSNDFLFGSAVSLQGYVVNFASQAYGTGPATNTLGILMRGGQSGAYGQGNMGVLSIMSGTKPDISSLTSTNAPAGTSILWRVTTYGDTAGSQWFVGNNWFTNPTVLTTAFRAATATGIASWFWICTTNSDVFGNIGGSVYHNITGDIGLLGSGSDMEMASLAVATGQFLRVININLRLPTTLF